MTHRLSDKEVKRILFEAPASEVWDYPGPLLNHVVSIWDAVQEDIKQRSPWWRKYNFPPLTRKEVTGND